MERAGCDREGTSRNCNMSSLSSFLIFADTFVLSGDVDFRGRILVSHVAPVNVAV